MLYKKFSPSGLWSCIAFLFAFLLSDERLLAQKSLPVIMASSDKIVIKDGYVVREGIWNLSPETKPDIYHALKTFVRKTVTFYTNSDSISFNVSPGNQYDFVILLNGKDSCFTRISVENQHNNSISGSAIPVATELLVMDFVVFRDQLKKEHPGLYRYKSKKTIDKLLDSCLLSIDKPLTRLEFGKKILFLTSQIQDGHTGTNISSLLLKSFQESTKLFPLYLYFAGNEAFVSCDITKRFPVGTQILSINNESIAAIRKKLFQYLPSDGSIETKKYQTLNNNGAFPFLFKWIYGHGDDITIKYKNLDQEIKVAEVAAQLVQDYECNMKNVNSETKDLELKYVDGQTALLTVKTFDENRLKRNGFNFKEFLDRTFSELNEKQTHNLIIDLRGNAGGLDEYGSMLYSYLTDKPFKYYASIQSADRSITTDENRMLGLLQPRKKSYKGRVLILINGLSFSTTAEFCAFARSSKRAQFIGEETGGGYYGNTSGQTIRIELPNSKIIVIIPRFMYINNVKTAKFPDRGVIPDYTVLPDVFDFYNGDDVQLKKAIEVTRTVGK